MRYCGSKAKFVKKFLPIITEHLTDDMMFVDAFCGGANVISIIDHKNKMGIELNPYVCGLWQFIKYNTTNGKKPEEYIPQSLTEEEYYDIKRNYMMQTNAYPKWKVGYVGSALSFGGAWFNGYARYNPNKKEDHIKEAFNGIKKQIEEFKYLETTEFINASYDMVKIPKKSVIYCDPPYQDTKKYESDFDHAKFWNWVRKMSKAGHYVYVSEYSAPSDFKCVWSKGKKDGMGSAKTGVSKLKIEKLFVYNGKKD